MHQRAGVLGAQGLLGLTANHFADLLAHPGVSEEMTLGSRVGVMAYHGGNLEVGTDLIADAVAERIGASRYVVRQPDDLRWHIPSRHFRPEHSEHLASFLDHVDHVVTLHGYGRRTMFTTVLLGGRNRALARHVADHLRSALPGYEVIDELEDIPVELRGLHGSNPVNRPRLDGVQIELPPRVRGNGPFWTGWDGGWPAPHTADLVDGLVAALADRGPGAVTAPAAP